MKDVLLLFPNRETTFQSDSCLLIRFEMVFVYMESIFVCKFLIRLSVIDFELLLVSLDVVM